MTKQLKSLFSQLCYQLNMPNYNELKSTKGVKCLKLDFNAIYGGYRIDIVNADTSESFFHHSSRIKSSEMVSYIQGLILGVNIGKQNTIKPIY